MKPLFFLLSVIAFFAPLYYHIFNFIPDHTQRAAFLPIMNSFSYWFMNMHDFLLLIVFKKDFFEFFYMAPLFFGFHVEKMIPFMVLNCH